MWHEARRQEKKIRGLMVDYKKRAERRREFYEKIKADPAQFVRIFGRPCKINLDPAVALAAESPQSMMPWQGNKDNMIDRFDVRAHLDILPPEKSYKIQLSKDEEEDERKLNYERYRTLVENDSAGLTEEQCLQQIYLDEQFGPINKDNEDEKNRLKDKKAAIGFTYEDSTPAEENEDSDSSSEEEDVETLDLDVTLDIDQLNAEQKVLINQCAEQYGMKKDDYTRLLKRDKDEQEALRLAKLLEEEKAQFAGRKSRRERRAYKEKRMAGRKISPPSYAARDSPKYEPYKRSTSRSLSKSPSHSRSKSRSVTPPKRPGRKMYITSFCLNESDDDVGVVHGPALPPSLAPKHSDKSDSTHGTAWESKANRQDTRRRFDRSHSPTSPRSKDRQYMKQASKKSRSRSRSRRSRSRSRTRRSRSRSRSRRSRSRSRRSRSRSRRSRSRSGRSRSRSRRSGSRSRSKRSWSRNRSRRSRSRSRTRRSWPRPDYRGSRDRFRRGGPMRYIPRQPRRRSRSRSRSHSRSRRRYSSRSESSRSRSRSNSRSRSRSKSSSGSSRSSSRSRSKSRSKSPANQKQKAPVKRYRRDSLSSKDSDSDLGEEFKSKKESVKKPAKPVVQVGKPLPFSQGQAKLTPQEKLKKKMQLALSKQYKADKKAEIVKQEKIVQERVDREEELRQRAVEMRRRERERRHREKEADQSLNSDSSVDSSPPRRRNRSRSASPSVSPPPKKNRRARSRSASPDSKLVSY